MTNKEEVDKRLLLSAAMNNEATAIVVKDMNVFLLLIYALGHLECVPHNVI